MTTRDKQIKDLRTRMNQIDDLLEVKRALGKCKNCQHRKNDIQGMLNLSICFKCVHLGDCQIRLGVGILPCKHFIDIDALIGKPKVSCEDCIHRGYFVFNQYSGGEYYCKDDGYTKAYIKNKNHDCKDHQKERRGSNHGKELSCEDCRYNDRGNKFCIDFKLSSKSKKCSGFKQERRK